MAVAAAAFSPTDQKFLPPDVAFTTMSGEGDAWIWWALLGGAVAIGAIVAAMATRHRRAAWVVAGLGLVFMAFSLVRLLG